jgi:hypothetical protein
MPYPGPAGAWRHAGAKACGNDVAAELTGLHLADALADNAPVDTGATSRALAHVGEPEKTPGGWAIGVGDKPKTRSPDEPARPSLPSLPSCESSRDTDAPWCGGLPQV